MGSGATKYKSVQEALDAGVSQADVDAYMKDRKPAFDSFGIYQGTWWSPGYSYNLGVDFTLKNGKDASTTGFGKSRMIPTTSVAVVN